MPASCSSRPSSSATGASPRRSASARSRPGSSTRRTACRSGATTSGPTISTSRASSASTSRQAPPPIACFTATAKPDVIEDLREHFRDELGVELTGFFGGHERTNLATRSSRSRKPRSRPADPASSFAASLPGSGGAIVFAATRRKAENLAEQIRGRGLAVRRASTLGWNPAPRSERAAAVPRRRAPRHRRDERLRHGRRQARHPRRRARGHSRVRSRTTCRKPGRAGRDGDPARCVLLFDEEDVETQFGLSARSRLTQRDFAGMLKALRTPRRDGCAATRSS